MPFDLIDPGRADAAVKAHTVGTHRIVAPEETLARVKPFLPVMGITRVANVTGLDCVGIPVVMVTRPNSRSVSVSQGKGVTLAAARTSGVMESIESFHAERIMRPLVFASYEELRWSRRVADVERLPRLLDDFDPHLPILWIEGEDLFSGEARLVPFEMVHLNHTTQAPPGAGCFPRNSNGLASGNHRLEAISHAITELVERDAHTLWGLGSRAAQDETRLDLDTVADPVCRSLIERFEDAGVAVGAWDMTSDVGLPAFLVRIVQREESPVHTIRPAVGMGCHAAREIALSRALTEAAQSRLTFISGARDDMARGEYERHLDPAMHARWHSLITQGAGRRAFTDAPGVQGRTIEDDLAFQLGRLKAVGIEEAVAVDLSRPEFGIPVVRVVIPGLEGVADRGDCVLGERARRIVQNACPKERAG